jgi:hypothetical protein
VSGALRRWGPSAIALAAGAGIALLSRGGDAPPPAAPGPGGTPPALAGPPTPPGHAPAGGHPRVAGAPPTPAPDPWAGPWHAQPVRSRTLPLVERIPCSWRAGPPVAVHARVRAPVDAIVARRGAAVREGDLLLRLSGVHWQRELEQATAAKDDARVARARDALAHLEVRAPADGVVFDVRVLLGDVPMIGEGALPVVVLFDWESLRIEGTAPEVLAPLLAPGAGVLLAFGEGPPVRGRIASLGEPGPGGARAVVAEAVDPPDAPPESEEARCHILVPTGTREVLVVPRAALREREGRWWIRVVPASGIPVEREVHPGEAVDETLVEVRAGVGRTEGVAVPGKAPAPGGR